MDQVIKQNNLDFDFKDKSKSKAIIKSKREANIELLRFVLALFVVIIHTIGGPTIVFARGSVPCFALITGYFLIRKQDDFRFLRFIPTLFLLLFLNVILSLIFNLISVNTIDKQLVEGTEEWLKLIFFGTNPMWYMWAILFVYILSPFINEGMKRMSTFSSGFLIVSLFLIFQISGLIKFSYISSSGYYHLEGFFVVLYSYMFGAFLALHCENFFRRKSLIWIIFASTLIISYIFVALYYLVYPNANTWFQMARSNHGFMSIFIAFSFFAVFKTFEIKDNKFIFYLGALSTVIYAFHQTFIDFLDLYIIGFLKEDLWLEILYTLARFAIAMTGSLVISVIMYYPFKYLNNHISRLVNKLIVKMENKFNRVNNKTTIE
ncbi:acyltransferase [Spiroplasma sp. BIUS-1]|uniref:acyltransferase family protein n=1 Tax=Spiroplasma sp. BIUS-1 TaxID=216964 RepID=UPI0013972132|nr:acyltransferase [Spiroplasma sp. BIUS-1]QHX36677.1 hypothetical protein SBIUS_v1c04240 [Spiroplasma sp. BIUS-1]